LAICFATASCESCAGAGITWIFASVDGVAGVIGVAGEAAVEPPALLEPLLSREAQLVELAVASVRLLLPAGPQANPLEPEIQARIRRDKRSNLLEESNSPDVPAISNSSPI